jgi:predicted PolB exonuclease-like 3'-5' exonuclease
MLLGVHPSIVLDRKKYGNSNVVDLMRELYGDSPAMGMKPTCKLMGIEPDAGDCEGSQVYEMFKAGHRDEICKYNESDVVLCQKLRRKMSGYFTA